MRQFYQGFGYDRLSGDSVYMPNASIPELSYQHRRCAEELEGQRHRREVLKVLLGEAKRARLPMWTAATTDALATTRKKINRVAARKSRLERRLRASELPTSVRLAG